ncbi:MAG: DUF4276 family protein [Deltaproteobacteria bacterium]|nr:DUF4276 family protein [Deltaproteobacteria bacterium]
MHLEILVEEPSAEAALSNLLPKILERRASFRIHSFRGKQDLLSRLPDRLRGYASWMPSDWRIVVLVDRDAEDCKVLKKRLEKISADTGLVTKTRARSRKVLQVVNRLAVEELEAWYFGDVEALVSAYPGVSPALGRKTKYRDPDAIAGGTWEALERVLKRAGYYPGGLSKIEAAKSISMNMIPERNRSHSFQVFCEGIRSILS